MSRHSEPQTLDEARQYVAISADCARRLISPPPGKNIWYGMIQRGEVPSRRLGTRIYVPVAEFLAVFGMDCAWNVPQAEPDSAPPTIGRDGGARS